MKKSIFLKLAEVLVVAIVLSLLLNYFIMYHNAKKSFVEESEHIFAQMENLVIQNSREAEKTRKEYNNICLTRAHIAAYILSDEQNIPHTKAGWKHLTELLDVDEIHLFDTAGVIVNGSEEKYYGYAFTSGKQMSFFLPMLEDKDLELCQGVEPNTAESKNMQYAATWNEKGAFIVEIGMEPVRVLEAMENVEFSRIFSLLIVNGNDSIYAFDSEGSAIIGSTMSDDLGKGAAEVGFHPDQETGQVFKEYIHGEKSFVVYEKLNGIILARTIPVLKIHEDLSGETASIALFVVLASGFAVWVIMRLLDRHIIGGITRINQGLLRITEGDLSVKLRENSVPEFGEMCERINDMIASLLEVARTREKLARAQELAKAKNEFLSRMSHDIRTPVNGMIGTLYILERSLQDPDAVQESVEKLKTTSTQLQLLVDDALDMSRLEQGAVKLVDESFVLEDVVEHGVHSMQELAGREEISVRSDFSGMHHRQFVGSQIHVQRIVMNLVSNAVKYNRPGGTVWIDLREEEQDGETSTIVLTVRDTGIGISQDFLKRIFLPFEREYNDKSMNRTGTGLGMAITKELVDLMHGEIRVESEIDVGTTFTVRLPLRLDTAAAQPRKREYHAPDLSGKRILIVEDIALNREILLFMIRETKAAVTAVENGQLAVEEFERGEYDLILMDVMMPVMNGHEATRRIRQSDRPTAKTIPIIALTANAFDEDILACRASGMNDHVAKPVNLDELMQTITNYL